MIKILFIGMTPNMGGIETFLVNIFSKLNGPHFHFDFLNIYKTRLAYSKYIINNGGIIQQATIPTNFFKYFTRRHIANKFFKKHHNYNVVHLNAVNINAIFWAKSANKYHIKNIIIHSHNDRFTYTSVIKKCLSLITSIVNIKYINRYKNIHELAASNKCGKWMFHNDNYKVINNGIDVNKFKFNPLIRKKLKNKFHLNGFKVVITVARLEHQKNYFRIFKIFYNIHKLDKYTKLIIVGDGSERQALIKFAKELHISNDIIFLGIISDVYKILDVADLMIMPSFYEGLPFSLIEAQSCGVRALVSKAIPVSANVTNEVTYLSLDDNDELWSSLAIDLLNHPLDDNRKYIMNNDVSNSKFNINKTINIMKNIYLGK